MDTRQNKAGSMEQPVDALLKHLIAWLRDELQGQTMRLDTLRELRLSMSRRDPSECERIISVVQSQEEQARARERKCQLLLGKFAQAWSMDVDACKLRVVGERAGADGEFILESRAKLQELLQAVALESKHVSATARMHRGLILDVLNAIFDRSPGDPLAEQGHLLDAEA